MRRRAGPRLQPGTPAESLRQQPLSHSIAASGPQADTGWNSLVAAARTAGWSIGFTPRGGVVFSRAGSKVYGPTATANPEAVAEVHERLRHADRLAAGRPS